MGHWKNDRYPGKEAVLRVIRGILTGCDTSTKLLGIGMGLALKEFAKSSILKDLPISSKDVLRAGEIIITNHPGGAHYEGPDIQGKKSPC